MRKLQLFSISFLLILSFTDALSEKSDHKSDEVQRDAYGVKDIQQNTKSNFEFWVSNYGITGLDIVNSKGGGYWPRGSQNQYLFGSGVWFGTQKRHPESGVLRKLVEITYNPNTGGSWMVPGRIEDGPEAIEEDTKNYRLYFSTDFNENGEPLDKQDGPNWPIWDTDPGLRQLGQGYMGYFIHDTYSRIIEVFPTGPVYISDEDIFCTYKDTDLDQYDAGAVQREAEGYPMQLQYEQTIYTWSSGVMKDQIIVKYNIINFSSDTLFQCYFAPLFDTDLAHSSSSQSGASNDRTRYYKDESVEFGCQWTNTDRGEAGHGFGYMGMSLLSTPAVDENNFLRKDKNVYSKEEQLGLTTFHNWSIADDKKTNADRYDYLSSEEIDGDNGPGDKRIIMSTGPFHLLPGDTVTVITQMAFAEPSVEIDGDGSDEDMAELISSIKAGQDFFLNELFTGVEEYDSKDLSAENAICYPNPFDGKATIEFNNPATEYVNIIICDILGQKIAHLHSGLLSDGPQRLNFNINNLENGIYFCRISSSSSSKTVKLVKIN